MDDFYNQTVASADTSFAQLQVARVDPMTGGELGVDSTVSITGDAVFQIQAGMANLSVSIRPAFLFDLKSERAELARHVIVFASGEDPVELRKLSSTGISVAFAIGHSVCPSGYILAPDSPAALRGNSSAVTTAGCVYCRAGTYTLSPLARGSNNGLVPTCFNCLPNSVCAGGDDVQLGLGEWAASQQGMYILERCPPAHQLINSIGGVFNHDVQVFYKEYR